MFFFFLLTIRTECETRGGSSIHELDERRYTMYVLLYNMSVELEDIEKFSLFYGKGVSQEHPMISHADNSATVHQG